MSTETKPIILFAIFSTVGHADAKHLSGRTKSGKKHSAAAPIRKPIQTKPRKAGTRQTLGYGNKYSRRARPFRPRNRSAGADYQSSHQQGDCRQTEHQPDHRHLTPQEYHREAGYQVRVRADYLCRDARICGSGQNIILQPDTSEAKSFQKNFAPISVLMC